MPTRRHEKGPGSLPGLVHFSGDPPVGEAAAVEAALDTVFHRVILAPAAQEISVERVGRAILADRRLRGDEGLGDHLPAEDAADPVGLAWSLEPVLAQRCDVEQAEQIGDELFGGGFGHGAALRARIAPVKPPRA